jgi:hypothetical protein
MFITLLDLHMYSLKMMPILTDFGRKYPNSNILSKRRMKNINNPFKYSNILIPTHLTSNSVHDLHKNIRSIRP